MKWQRVKEGKGEEKVCGINEADVCKMGYPLLIKVHQIVFKGIDH